MNLARWCSLVLLLGLVACGGADKRDDDVDGPGAADLVAADVPDAVPRREPRSRYGNPPEYEVFGKTYRVMASGRGYRERGTASWYGSKFHGRRTSSGESYDMHKATAAHKTLPLPSYAEVTNLDNGRKVIVKINDRGPFVDDRLIDMSYGAAVRLDMIRTGTARVEVRVIESPEELAPTTVAQRPEGVFLQVGAFDGREAAEELVGRMMVQDLQPVSMRRVAGLYKVWVGPFKSERALERMRTRIVELGYDRPHKVSP